jgi:hypothetical protein
LVNERAANFVVRNLNQAMPPRRRIEPRRNYNARMNPDPVRSPRRKQRPETHPSASTSEARRASASPADPPRVRADSAIFSDLLLLGELLGDALIVDDEWRIAAQHGGHMTVESMQGAGTTFTLRLPLLPHIG